MCMKKKTILALLLSLLLLASLPTAAWAAAPLQTLQTEIAPSGFAVRDGSLYMADPYNQAIWLLEDGEARILAGGGAKDSRGKSFAGYHDAAFTEALFAAPWDLLPYKEGLLVSDSENHVLRYLNLEEETVETLSGIGLPAHGDGRLGYVAYQRPTGLALGEEGLVYVADTDNHVIRAMDEDGNVSTVAGIAHKPGTKLGELWQARLHSPMGLCYADGVLYIADSGNHRIVALENGELRLVAGASLSGAEAIEGGYRDGEAAQAEFSYPQDLALAADGSIYVADTGNGAIRLIRDGQVSTVYSMEEGTYPVSPAGLWLEGETLYVGDRFSRLLLKAE